MSEKTSKEKLEDHLVLELTESQARVLTKELEYFVNEGYFSRKDSVVLSVYHKLRGLLDEPNIKVTRVLHAHGASFKI